MMRKLFVNTVQPTLKMYKNLNKMNIRRSIPTKFMLILSMIVGVFGLYQIILSILGDTYLKDIILGVFCIAIMISFILLYLYGHNMLAEKSMRIQGKTAYMDFEVIVYKDMLEVKSNKTKGNIPIKYFNKIYEDNQYFYISYNKKNIMKSFVVLDKDGFSIGNTDDFRNFIKENIRCNKSKKRSDRK